MVRKGLAKDRRNCKYEKDLRLSKIIALMRLARKIRRVQEIVLKVKTPSMSLLDMTAKKKKKKKKKKNQ